MIIDKEMYMWDGDDHKSVYRYIAQNPHTTLDGLERYEDIAFTNHFKIDFWSFSSQINLFLSIFVFMLYMSHFVARSSLSSCISKASIACIL